MENYYTRIADRYRTLRTTDREPVDFMCGLLPTTGRIQAADMGCGVGRYVKLILETLRDRVFIYCFDTNEYMLNRLEHHLAEEGKSGFSAKVADAREVPLEDMSLDAVFCFNSIHHIGIVSFLREVSRILKPGGSLFVYTRSRTQNARTVWGRYFPLFRRKESRLYEPEEFEFKVGKFLEFEIETAKTFLYERKNSKRDLMEKASEHHYSTFHFYEPEEFDRALKSFKENLEREFEGDVEWEDEKTMYVLKKRA